MSIRADLFVATRSDAPRYEASLRRGEKPPFPEVHVSSHLTNLEFGTLWAILERRPWNPERHMLMDLSPEEGSDTWLNEFPGQLTELLAALDDKDADEALETWAATDELRCDPGDLRPGLTALRTLARSALRQGKTVFLWGAV